MQWMLRIVTQKITNFLFCLKTVENTNIYLIKFVTLSTKVNILFFNIYNNNVDLKRLETRPTLLT